MRVVGYIRESADAADTRSAFAQQEELRLHAIDNGYQLVSMCQDLRFPGHAPNRDGYVSLLGVIAAGGVDAVLVPGLATLSSDAIVQEIMLWDLKGRGVRVISTRVVDLRLLEDGAQLDADRLVIRDVLVRVGEHSRSLGGSGRLTAATPPNLDVLVQIVSADAAEHN